jgi:membrane protein
MRAGRAAAALWLERFRLARCADAASNLAFTTLIAIVPLIAIAFAIVSAFPVFERTTNELRRFVAENLLPEAAERLFSVYVSEFAAKAASVSALGLALLVITAVILVITIEGAFDDIWRTERRGNRVPRLAAYLTVVIVGPVLIGTGLWLTSIAVSFSLGWYASLDTAVLFALRLTPFILTTLALALLYYALPGAAVRGVDALTGGLVAGVLFEAAKRGFALYVTHMGSYQIVYGAFATVPIFLMWVYLSWLVVLAGAVLVAVLPQARAPSSTNC